MRRILLAAVLAFANAGTGLAAATDLSTAFQCGDTLVSGVFTVDQVAITVAGKDYVLPRVPAGSGAKYEINSGTDQVLFWNSGDQAILTIGDMTYPACARVDATSPE